MTKRMLMDASHPEETRVVVVDGNRVEELDFESRNKRQLRGNVYLARVTRVEPSLQAAFIEYGGNRHGFLAFSEIHPDYYKIPEADKLALKAQEEEDQREAEEEDEKRKAASAKSRRRTKSDEEDDDDADDEDDNIADDDEDEDERDDNLDPDEDDAADADDAEVAAEQVKVASNRRKRISRRRYKIQEVVKRGQILLVQAVKEERGNKGAAMTTYLSLAGRYCVLMPNTPRGGGISRKIANGSDRKRLKSIMGSLEVPKGMGVIVRTAGAKRTKAEIERDYEYLSRLWSDIRDTTMKSTAPALIHEEGNLIKRSIRDMYNKDIEEVLIQGDEAYETASTFINMLMPSHSKFVKRYEDDIPLFLRYSVEQQIESSLDATVQLKSGGYLVIHPTEALISVDVNSGRSTKERNIERTALKTNLEAAEELARQMRLRDLAGLIVVDFIDMDENKNNRAVERKMKDALASDRARIQTSRISQFGLMEISRQRRRRSLLEGSTTVCPHCTGVGRKRTVESSALAAIRAVEEFAVRGKAKRIRLKTSQDVALYLLNEKRDLLTRVDETADVFTEVLGEDGFIRPHFEIEVIEAREDNRGDPLKKIEQDIRKETQDTKRKPKPKAEEPEDEDEDASGEQEGRSEISETDEDRKPRRRGRRGRRGGRGRNRKSDETSETGDSDALEVIEPKTDNSDTPDQGDVQKDGKSDDTSGKGRGRGRRRRAPSKSKGADTTDAATDIQVDAKAETVDVPEDAPKRRPSNRRKAPAKRPSVTEAVDVEDKTEAPKRRRKAPSKIKADDAAAVEDKPKRTRKAPAKRPSVTEAVETDAPAKPKRTRKAPAKTAAAKATSKTSDDVADKPKRTRKAPTKTKATEAKAAETPKRTRKAPTKKAPAKKAPAQAAATEAKAKSVTAKKAPAKSAAKATKKAPAKPRAKAATPKAEVTKTEAPKRVRKAPAKAAANPDVKATQVTEPAPAPKAAATPAPKPAPAPKETGEKPKRRLGWWNRKK